MEDSDDIPLANLNIANQVRVSRSPFPLAIKRKKGKKGKQEKKAKKAGKKAKKAAEAEAEEKRKLRRDKLKRNLRTTKAPEEEEEKENTCLAHPALVVPLEQQAEFGIHLPAPAEAFDPRCSKCKNPIDQTKRARVTGKCF